MTALCPKVAINSWGVLRELAIAGRGIARLPELDVQHALSDGKLVEVLSEYAPPPVACYAVFPSARNLSPSVRAMIDTLIERLCAESCRLHGANKPAQADKMVSSSSA
jgi:DNA-binding transcriptional LysR family regulator